MDEFAIYRAIDALNWSSLKLMAESPLMYKWRLENPRPDTAALTLGRAIHMAILEPEKFAENYAARPHGLDLRTKSGREWKETTEEYGFEILTEDQGDVIERCVASVNAHEPARALLEGTRKEETITWTDPELGVECKGRLDAIAPDRLVDLKTTRDMGRFERDAADLLYHGQLAWYLDGAIASGKLSPDGEVYVRRRYSEEGEFDEEALRHPVYMVVVETKEPYDVAALQVPPYVLEAGRTLYRELLELWVACRESDLWPGRFPAVSQFELPRWARGLEESEEF
jgi:exodeoxyribonuclease VIII